MYFIYSILIILLVQHVTVISHVKSNLINCQKDAFPPNASDEITSFTLNLDDPPSKRWNPIIKDKTVELKKLFNEVNYLVELLVGKKIYNLIYEQIYKIADALPYPYSEEIKGIAETTGLPLEHIADALPYPYSEEIKGIAETTGLPLEHVTVYNIFYELYVLCTSIIVQDPYGNIFHGRNLDNGALLGWDIKNKTWEVTENLKPLTVQVNWKRGNKTIYKSINFVGYVGILTAVKEKKFSFSINKRMSLNNGLVGLFEWMFLHDHKQHWVSLLAREVMENADDFESAKRILSNKRLLAPVYYILAGVNPGEGVIITRDRDNVNILPLGSTKSKYASWYLIQTNYDYWKRVPFFDNRRYPSKLCLDKASGKNASLSLLYNVLSTKPVLNKSTVYTALMEAKSGTIEAWRRYCPNPCFPW